MLARSEAFERGIPCTLSTSASSSESFQDDDDDRHREHSSESLSETIKLHEEPHRPSEEDMFLRPQITPSILSFPLLLRRHVLESGHKLLEQDSLACLPKAADDKAWRMARLLSDFFQEDVDS